MKKTIKIFWIIAAGLLITGLILGGIGFCHLSGPEELSLNSQQNTGLPVTVTQPFTDVVIEETAGDIQLRSTPQNNATVTGPRTGSVVYEVEVTNGVLVIRPTRSVELFSFYEENTPLTVSLPQAVYHSITVTTESGDICCSGEWQVRQAKLSAESGEISLINGQYGQLTLSTESGDISLYDLHCEDITATAESGDIEAENVLAKNAVTAATESGDMEWENCDAEKLTLTAESGDISGHLLTDKIFQANSESGSVHVPEADKGSVCRIHTGSGNIDFQ